MDTFLSVLSFLVSSSPETFVKEEKKRISMGLGGGATVESVGHNAISESKRLAPHLGKLPNQYPRTSLLAVLPSTSSSTPSPWECSSGAGATPFIEFELRGGERVWSSLSVRIPGKKKRRSSTRAACVSGNVIVAAACART